MSAIMTIKKLLRKRGLDVVKYHSFWDDIAKPRGIETILDIGANDGSFAQWLREQFPEAEIISFEPLNEPFERLMERMEGDEKFRAYNVALGETAGTQMIHHSASHPSSSLLPMATLHKELYPHSVEHIDETIRIERLDDLMRSEHLDSPILAKIDVQGFEAGVIKGGRETLSKADIVLVENSFVTLFEGQALFGEIHSLMQSLGFAYRGRSEVHYDPHTKMPIYEDSVFIKE
jgi:FkbM family methyltransferase